jgi:hypothetical protein
MKTVGSTLRAWSVSTRLALRQYENEDWEDLGKTFKSVHAKAKRAKHCLWLVPPRWQRVAKFSMSFANASDDIHGYATKLVDKGIERAILEEIALEALGKLPILGQFYVAAIQSFPGIIRGYKGLVSCQVRMLDSAGNGKNFRHACREDNPSY